METVLIRREDNGTLTFGDCSLETKQKVEDFPVDGDLYKVKTYKEITKLEKNGSFVYESVPGTNVTDFSSTDAGMSFVVSGSSDAQITVELMEEQEYEVLINDAASGTMQTNLGGKLSINVELNDDSQVKVQILSK